MDHRLITILTILIMNMAGSDARATNTPIGPTIAIDPTVPASPTITIDPTVPASPTITIDPIISTDSASCILPFTRAGNLILIQAKADTATGFFVLDTG